MSSPPASFDAPPVRSRVLLHLGVPAADEAIHRHPADGAQSRTLQPEYQPETTGHCWRRTTEHLLSDWYLDRRAALPLAIALLAYAAVVVLELGPLGVAILVGLSILLAAKRCGAGHRNP